MSATSSTCEAGAEAAGRAPTAGGLKCGAAGAIPVAMWRPALSASIALALAGCGGSPPPPPIPAPTPPSPEPPPPAAEAPSLSELNAAARRGAVTETLHGIEIADPYRSLEVDSPQTQAWIDAQTEHTRRALAAFEDEARAARIEELLSIGLIGRVAVGGDRVFYTKRDADREQPALFYAEGGTAQAAPLVDPEAAGERAALDWFHPSPGGRFVAYGISHNGDERSTLHVLEVETRRVLDERIPRTKWCNLEWLHDESGFYYTRYPKPDEAGFDADNEDSYFPRVFFHAIGGDPDDDPLVYGAERGTDFPGVSVSDDDRWLVLTVFRGWSASDVFLYDRGRTAARRSPAPGEGEAWAEVISGQQHLTYGTVHRGTLYLATNKDAPKTRIVAVSTRRPADHARWRDVVPEGEAALESWSLAGDRFVLHYVDDVRSRLRLVDLRGRDGVEVELPMRGEIGRLSASASGSLVAFEFSSYLQAPALYTFDAATPAPTRVDQVEAQVDFSDLELELVRVPSEDGTEIPVHLVHRRGMQRDGSNPVLLTGYGGFNVSLLPSFARNALYWMERGGVYAVANLRGGSEFGEEWHRAGNLDNKENVFEDMEAVLRWLSSSGISRPERIAITGASNGGLLMGAMITRCPDAFAVAATYVGLYDMVRYHRFPPAELWVSEYGSAEDAEQLRWLHAYSPYHRVREGTAYPAVLVETADHDSRVYWGHSTKLAAALQEATSSERPIYFYMVRQVGHGAGTRRSDIADKYARMYTFIESQLGMR